MTSLTWIKLISQLMEDKLTESYKISGDKEERKNNSGISSLTENREQNKSSRIIPILGTKRKSLDLATTNILKMGLIG